MCNVTKVVCLILAILTPPQQHIPCKYTDHFQISYLPVIYLHFPLVPSFPSRTIIILCRTALCFFTSVEFEMVAKKISCNTSIVIEGIVWRRSQLCLKGFNSLLKERLLCCRVSLKGWVVPLALRVWVCQFIYTFFYTFWLISNTNLVCYVCKTSSSVSLVFSQCLWSKAHSSHLGEPNS